eukprot:3556439-Prorocentrum_lima.AAC.1
MFKILGPWPCASGGRCGRVLLLPINCQAKGSAHLGAYLKLRGKDLTGPDQFVGLGLAWVAMALG